MPPPKPFALVQAEPRRQGNEQHDEPEPKPEHPKYDGQLGAGEARVPPSRPSTHHETEPEHHSQLEYEPDDHGQPEHHEKPEHKPEQHDQPE